VTVLRALSGIAVFWPLLIVAILHTCEPRRDVRPEELSWTK
jgi:hypothetical protein